MFNTNSIYTTKLFDQKAIYLTKADFDVHADGIHDDTAVIQQAINKVQETVKYGILFIPEGRYRLTDTIYVWKGIRLIGYGKNRPVFVLNEKTPGFSTGTTKYMIHFASDKPQEGKPIRDANPGTFYSAISNIDFEIQTGNKNAVCIRSHFAQHSFLSNIVFQIGDGLAGVDEVGNEIENCLFLGGEYGIITTKPSPSWPFFMVDSRFENHKKAAIRTEEGGLTLVRNQFINVPTVISINPDRAEELWMEDCLMKQVEGPAIIISDEFNARPQINLKNIVCENVPTFAKFRLSGKTIHSNEPLYLVNEFCHGNQIDDLGETPTIKTTYEFKKLDQLIEFKNDIPALPGCETWMNIDSLGAIGDGLFDNTSILIEAIEKYPVLYFPTGRYRVTDTITMKEHTVLIGLSPIASQLLITDKTPHFSGAGAVKPLLVAPSNGVNIVTGIGLDTGGINERAVACKWMAGSNSYMNDVKFIGGHGTYHPDGSPVPVYNTNRLGDGNKDRKWDSQYPSLWVTNNGGGTFKDIWSASPYAQAGIYISNTKTEGRMYATSIEHHVRYEVKLENVSNWKFYDMQTEEELGESWNALPVSIENCENLLFANLYLYRVMSMNTPYPHAVTLKNCKQLEFRGMHVYSPSKYSYDNTLFDETHHVYIRSREIAKLTVTGNTPKPNIPNQVEKLLSGYDYIDGITMDNTGTLYFIDSRWHFIYRYSPKTKEVELVCDAPIHPTCLTFDKSNQLMVATTTGAVYTLNPSNWMETIQLLEETTVKGNQTVYPGHRWRDEHNFLTAVVDKSDVYFVSLDKSISIPKCWDLPRSHSLRKAEFGKPFYVADEFGQKTYALEVKEDGTLENPKLFAEEGEFDVAVDSKGNVYIAAGQIFVYDPSGKQIDLIQVPERPTCLVFDEKDILYITAGTSLYKYHTR